MENNFSVKPVTLDHTIKNIVDAIDKGYELQQLDTETADVEQRLDYSDCLIMKPDYQREYRSTNEDESSLIESVLVGIPIPPVFLCSSRYKGVQVLNVVDGQHRLYAFYRFRKGLFPLSELPLLGEYSGKYFSELPIEQQEILITHKLPAYVFRNFPGKNFELEVFNRYNKGTKALTQQEIRNAVYASPHNEYISAFVEKTYKSTNGVLKSVYNITKDRFLKKKVHEGIFSILYVLEFGINVDFKDSTTYANEYMRIKSELANNMSEDETKMDLDETVSRFSEFNTWLEKCTEFTPYPLSKELYGISSKSYKFQTSMALIIPALYRKIYLQKQVCVKSFEEGVSMMKNALSNSFIEDPNYTASSTNSKEIFKLVERFGNDEDV